MFEDCRLPPLYSLRVLDGDAGIAGQARRLAESGADPATVLCAPRDDRLDCAVIVHPHLSPAEARLVLYVAALGLGDAIGSVVPAGVDLTFRWPDVIEANIGSVARIGVIMPDPLADDAVADWVVVTVTAIIGPLEGEELRTGFPETSLRDEGCADVTPEMLLESFSRHFLAWINRWQDDGFDPVRAMWLRHAPGHGEDVTVTAGGRKLSGVFDGIDDDGAMRLARGGKTRRIALAAAVTEPSC